MAPRGREKNVTGSAEIGKAGRKVDGGPVGNTSYEGRPGHGSGPAGGGGVKPGPQNTSANGPDRGVGGSSGGGILLALLAWLFLGKKKGTAAAGANGASSGSGSMLGKIVRIAIIALIVIFLFRSCSVSTSYNVSQSSYSSSSSSSSTGGSIDAQPETAPSQSSSTQQGAASQNGYYGLGDIGTIFGDTSGTGAYTVNTGASSNGWKFGDNRGKLNTSVASGARDKFYTPKSGDKVNVIIYMIGTDLESRSGMATSDLQEMAGANIADNVNVIIYGGGCKQWHNNVFTTSANRVIQLKSGGQVTVLAEDSTNTMTDPNTLAGFLQFVNKNFDAANSRNILILWDHGGGSVTGYGYDEVHSRSTSMDLSGLDQALKAGGMKYDFIGFDACLMATTETAVMCSNYADYLVASEESEPGIGWYYTNWLTKLSSDTGISTLEIGKQICDDFVSVCGQKCPGQSATLSVVDLAELQATVPSRLSAFANSTTDLINNNGYKQVANARAGSREFAKGNGIDQVDFIHFALNLGTEEGKAVGNTMLGAIKYNKTSNDMTNSYGLSMYFPYSSASYLSKADKVYKGIGFNADYTKCIQAFASYAGAGQASSPYGSVWDILGSGSQSGSSSSYGASSYGGSPYGGTSQSYGYDDLFGLLESMMGSGYYGRSINTQNAAAYIADNQLDDADLVWTDGVMKLDKEQWSLITEVTLSVFYEVDGEIVDLGTDLPGDCVTAEGWLVGSYDGTCTAINGIPVAYYHMNTFDDGSENWQIMGYVPCLVNGERARLILTFNEEHPYGFVSGVVYDKQDEGVSVVEKTVTETYTEDGQSEPGALRNGDVIEFLMDTYDEDGNYVCTRVRGEPLPVSGELEISYVKLTGGRADACYRIKDIYGRIHWSPVMENA